MKTALRKPTRVSVLDGFVTFEAKLSRAAVQHLKSEAGARAYLGSPTPARPNPDLEPVTFVYVGGIKDAEYGAFEKAAKGMKITHFFASSFSAEVTDFVLGNSANSHDRPCIAKVEPGEDPVVVSVGTWDASKMEAWIARNSHPVLSELGSHNFFDLSRGGTLLVVGCIDPEDSARSASFREALRTVARKESRRSSRYKLGYLDGAKWASFISQFNIEAGTLPRVFVLDAENSLFYEDPSVDEEEEIETFLKEIAEGKVAAYSDKMPHRWYRKFVSYLPWSAILLVVGVFAFYYIIKMLLNEDDEDSIDFGAGGGSDDELAPKEEASKKDD